MLEKRAQLSEKFLKKQGMEGEKSFRLVLLQKKGGGVTCFSREADGKNLPSAFNENISAAEVPRTDTERAVSDGISHLLHSSCACL